MFNPPVKHSMDDETILNKGRIVEDIVVVGISNFERLLVDGTGTTEQEEWMPFMVLGKN